MNFSVCMSVYRNDYPEHVRTALESITKKQTVKPSEVVLVVDGPVPEELSALITEYENRQPELFHVIRLEKNGGLGNALRLCVENARYGVCARMDSDDVAAADRFEKQVNYMEAHPKVDIVGGQITEFVDNEENVAGRRNVPLDDKSIKEYMKSRCAFNHMTVMFRKDSVLKAGNYQDWFWNEDYYLWLRMMLAGCLFGNLPETLVNVRGGREMYARRGGWRYFRSEAKLQYYMYCNGIIGGGYLLINIAKRLIVQVLLPNRLRGWVFRTFARS